MNCFKQTKRQIEKIKTHEIKDIIKKILGNHCYFCHQPLTKKGIVIHHLSYEGKKYTDFKTQLEYHEYLLKKVKSGDSNLVMAHSKCHRNNLN